MNYERVFLIQTLLSVAKIAFSWKKLENSFSSTGKVKKANSRNFLDLFVDFMDKFDIFLTSRLPYIFAVGKIDTSFWKN